MYILYNLTFIILSILLSPIILAAFIIKPKFRAGFFQKIGLYRINDNGKKSLWIHAVSVGEVNAIEHLVKKAKKEFPHLNIAITTTTKTGQEVAKSKFTNIADIITYFPYDFSFSVNSAIKAINPAVVVIAETEIWPAFLNKLKQNNIPAVLVNGRISPKSYKGYKKISFFIEKILQNFELILMQTQEDAFRMIDMGAEASKIQVMGNLKFDIESSLNKNEIKELKKSLKTDDNRILIVGSTHKGEDEIAINVYKRLRLEFKGIKLLIAPRHPERNDSVMRLICSTGLKIGLRSKNSDFKNSDIIILDTMGELGKIYSVADIAFIGGSFSNTGGHNPLEPALYGVPVISGPTVFNFRDIYNFMTENRSAFVVKDEEELLQKARELLKNKETYAASSSACFSIFKKNKGALDFALKQISGFIKV